MRSPTPERVQRALRVQRLMDADLLLPEEGNALPAEILRVIDLLQLTANYKVATPADRQQGGDCIIVPAVSNDEAKTLFPKGYTEVKPYLRATPQPNL